MNLAVRPARRLADVQEYYFSRKLKEVARLNAAGHDIVSLAIGCPDLPPSPATIDTLCQAVREPGAHAYQPTIGTRELREAMARFYRRWFGVELDPEREIQPLIGSKEGILHTTLAFVDAGDQVLVPDPGYPTYTSLSRLLGAERQPLLFHSQRGRTAFDFVHRRGERLLHRTQFDVEEPQHAGMARGHVGGQCGICFVDSQSEVQHRLGNVPPGAVGRRSGSGQRRPLAPPTQRAALCRASQTGGSHHGDPRLPI